MARKILVLRAVLFLVFFGVGLGALTVALLADELLEMYLTAGSLEATRDTNARLEAVCEDYDAVFEQLETDPNMVARLSRVVLGTDSGDAQTVYPKSTQEQRRSAEKVFSKTFPQESRDEPVPGWVANCCEPWGRKLLFVAGAGLIIIAFSCFGPTAGAAEPG